MTATLCPSNLGQRVVHLFQRRYLRKLFTQNSTNIGQNLHIKDTNKIIHSMKMSTEAEQRLQVPRPMLDSSQVFSPVTEDHKSFLDDLKPPIKRTYNFASLINESKSLQMLLKLGVSFYDIEHTNYNAAKYLVNLDFEKDCVPYIKFLVDNGLKEKNLGRFISEFPLIFREHLDDLQARINYLESKGFTEKMIAKALNRSCHLIYRKTKTIDHKLGVLQVEFNLPASILRSMVVSHPPIISLPEEQYKLIEFSLSQEFGFNHSEMLKILKGQPGILSIPRPQLLERLDLIHNKLGVSHEMIANFPKLIVAPRMDTMHRGYYLKKLNRAQYDPRLPLYISPSALYNPTDEQFCEKFAKTSINDYRLFIKDQ